MSEREMRITKKEKGKERQNRDEEKAEKRPLTRRLFSKCLGGSFTRSTLCRIYAHTHTRTYLLTHTNTDERHVRAQTELVHTRTRNSATTKILCLERIAVERGGGGLAEWEVAGDW